MRKGQAAMEFIMTYGWAILVVLVMIGALAYFGVLNPNKYIPDKCLFGPGVNCKDFQAKHNGGNMQVSFVIENKQGDAMTIQKMNVTTVGGTTQLASGCGSFPSATIGIDGQQSITCDFTGSPGIGQPVKLNAQITYLLARGVYNHTISGEIQTTVQS